MSSSKDDEDVRARTVARRYLRGRVRSTSDTLAFLRRHGFSAATATRVIAACHAQSLLDDEACARLWAEHWARRGYAWALIREKLSAKGLPDSAIERAARHVGSAAADDLARARHALESRTRLGQGTTQRVRLLRQLAARGFDNETIERVLPDDV